MAQLTQSIIQGAHRPDLLRDETLAHIFRQTAGRSPSKTALVFGNETLSYAQLDAWSDAIAPFLQQSEVGDDVHLDALSLVMKGEKLPAGSSWTGSPVRISQLAN